MLSSSAGMNVTEAAFFSSGNFEHLGNNYNANKQYTVKKEDCLTLHYY